MKETAMQLEEYFDFLAPDDIRLKGHRIAIEDVLFEHIHNAMTPQELAERFPSLNLEKIYAVLLYYYRNREEMDRYLTERLEHEERMRAEQEKHPTPLMIRLRKLRAERERVQKEMAVTV
jgi:uncharacterized protein (DUF433 family)